MEGNPANQKTSLKGNGLCNFFSALIFFFSALSPSV